MKISQLLHEDPVKKEFPWEEWSQYVRPVRCETEDEAIDFIKTAQDKDYKWCGVNEQGKTHWNDTQTRRANADGGLYYWCDKQEIFFATIGPTWIEPLYWKDYM